MRILVTGASSPLAVGVLRHLLLDHSTEIWCGHHRSAIPLQDSRLHVFDMDLESDKLLLPASFDLVLHFAGVTHASSESRYWKVNSEGTTRLARSVHANGCQRFVYISTRCATKGSGAYGESKLAAELELQKLDWKSLLIIRPSEIYGGSGNEGIDRMLALACKWRVVPMMFGNSNIQFAPMHLDDFTRITAELIQQQEDGVRIEEVCGPEDFGGVSLASRIGNYYRAVPIPLWWPGLPLVLKFLNKLGIGIVKPDQLTRLTSEKTATAASVGSRFTGIKRFLLD